MNRPAGVIVSAVLLFLAAAFFLAYMVLFYFSLYIVRSQSNVPQAEIPSYLFYAIQGFNLLVVLWAGITGIGLLRLKNWARLSALLIAGTAVTVAATGVPFFWFLPLPELQGADPQLWRTMHLIIAVVFGLPGAIGIWWLIYFTRPRVKAYFAGAVPADDGIPRRPQSITVIAWLLLTSAPIAILAVPFEVPLWFMGMMLRGWSAAAVNLFWGIAGTLAGYGLLKLKPWAYPLAIAVYLSGIVNQLALCAIPGAFERMMKDSRQISRLPASQEPPPLPPMPPMWVLITLTLAFAGVLFYFLLTRRKRFLDAAAARAASR
jgi:hypothetical protein